ncbi:hypothetical protein [Haloparvum sedimenti]|uniref:hypothetical protein n=1 Tax=Haloparvum sedimenti TaxID=1678448 RepID=UPI00071E950C|nr:hypothetical protein [Haloparvum sedimenti]
MAPSRRNGPPGRATDAAESHERRGWRGYGTTERGEKDPVGLLLHDATAAYADVAVFSLPVLIFLMDLPPTGTYSYKFAGLVALVTMAGTATLLRGGWVPALASETRGWVTYAPALLALRAGYYNAVLLAATVGTVGAASAVGVPLLAGLLALLTAAVATLLFPRVAEETARRT